MLIRHAWESDLPALTRIYNHYILNSQVTFDTEPLLPEQRRDWFGQYAEQGPYRLLVASGEQVLGFAYSSPYRPHPAFAQTVETSIYLAPEACGRGLGADLYARLFSELAAEKLHLAVAGIALPNPASLALHRRFGFSEVGVFDQYACKQGVYISSIWLQKRLDRA